jgi:hypothetical protein
MLFFCRQDSYGSNVTDVAQPSFIYLFAFAWIKPFRLYQVMAITIWIIQKYYIYAGIIGIAAIAETMSSIILKYQVVFSDFNTF